MRNRFDRFEHRQANSSAAADLKVVGRVSSLIRRSSAKCGVAALALLAMSAPALADACEDLRGALGNFTANSPTSNTYSDFANPGDILIFNVQTQSFAVVSVNGNNVVQVPTGTGSGQFTVPGSVGDPSIPINVQYTASSANATATTTFSTSCTNGEDVGSPIPPPPPNPTSTAPTLTDREKRNLSTLRSFANSGRAYVGLAFGLAALMGDTDDPDFVRNTVIGIGDDEDDFDGPTGVPPDAPDAQQPDNDFDIDFIGEGDEILFAPFPDQMTNDGLREIDRVVLGFNEFGLQPVEVVDSVFAFARAEVSLVDEDQLDIDGYAGNVMGGLVWRINQGFSIGVAGVGVMSDVKSTVMDNELESRGGGLGLYASYRPTSNFSVNAVGLAVLSTNDVTQNGGATGSYGSTDLTAQIGATYLQPLGDFFAEFDGGLSGSFQDNEGFTDSAGLTIPGDTVTTFNGRARASLNRPFALEDGSIFNLFARASVQHSFSSTTSVVIAGQTFTTDSTLFGLGGGLELFGAGGATFALDLDYSGIGANTQVITSSARLSFPLQ